MSEELFKAIKENDFNKVKRLIAAGADVNAVTKYGRTPLIQAGVKGNLDIANKLIEKGANVNVADNNGDTPLMRAIEFDNFGLANKLIEKGANVNAADNNGATPLFLAIASGNLELVERLIEKGANVYVADNNGNTPLMCAIGNENLELVERLIDKGTEINGANNDGDTPLLFAIASGSLELANKLIEKGAEINAANNDGDTPLLLAIASESFELANKLIEKGADINAANNDGNTPLKSALEFDNFELAEKLIDKGANVNIAIDEGYTLLMLAFQSEDIEFADKLIEKGADINAVVEGVGMTPLMLALQDEDIEFAYKLIEKGADVNAAGKGGVTPLMLALQNEKIEFAYKLIEKGADVNAANNDGDKPLILALNIGDLELADRLIDEGADLDLDKTLKLITNDTDRKEYFTHLQERGHILDAEYIELVVKNPASRLSQYSSDRQNTHASEITSANTQSLKNLKEAYPLTADQVEAKYAEAIAYMQSDAKRDFLVKIGKSSAAAAAQASSEKEDVTNRVNFMLNSGRSFTHLDSNTEFKHAVALIWSALSDEENLARINSEAGLTGAAAEQNNAEIKLNLMNKLVEANHEYTPDEINFGSAGGACKTGTFNKVMAAADGVHPAVDSYSRLRAKPIIEISEEELYKPANAEILNEIMRSTFAEINDDKKPAFLNYGLEINENLDREVRQALYKVLQRDAKKLFPEMDKELNIKDINSIFKVIDNKDFVTSLEKSKIVKYLPQASPVAKNALKQFYPQLSKINKAIGSSKDSKKLLQLDENDSAIRLETDVVVNMLEALNLGYNEEAVSILQNKKYITEKVAKEVNAVTKRNPHKKNKVNINSTDCLKKIFNDLTKGMNKALKAVCKKIYKFISEFAKLCNKVKGHRQNHIANSPVRILRPVNIGGSPQR